MSVALVERPATVLVVDDNLQNREVAEGHLVGAGYAGDPGRGGRRGARDDPSGSGPTWSCSTC